MPVATPFFMGSRLQDQVSRAALPPAEKGWSLAKSPAQAMRTKETNHKGLVKERSLFYFLIL